MAYGALTVGLAILSALGQDQVQNSQATSGSALVFTDKADYAPGSIAVIMGRGFLSGETVKLQVLHADGTPATGADHEPWSVVADPLGGLETTWHVCEDDCVGSHLELTAIGLSSGLTVRTVFTDSAPGPKRFLYTGGHGLNLAKLTTFGGAHVCYH